MASNKNVKNIAFKVIVPKNWSNDTKGKFWEDIIAELFQQQRWETTQRISFTGSEIDVLAEKKGTFEKAYIECKFNTSKIQSEVIDKLIGKAYRRGINRVFLVCTGDLGSDAKGVRRELEKQYQDPTYNGVKVEFWERQDLAEIFMKIRSIKSPNLQDLAIGSVKTATLVLTPEQTVWVLEEIGDQGLPTRAIIFPTSENEKIDLDKLKIYFGDNDLWRDIEIIDIQSFKKDKSYQKNIQTELEFEVVSSISCADTFNNSSRPCNPEYFVGRDSLKKDFWKFIKNVQKGNNLTRIICFSGPSGLGKSSLVLRLEADCQKAGYENFYLYHADVRSARNSLFVFSAIKIALQQAIDRDFINLSNHKVIIESIEQSLISNTSINLVLEELKRSNKVIIIFFDQFEEIFTKESMWSVYEVFEKVAYEIDSLKENIILGFCWRTGIVMPDGHKAYQLWHGLSDKREEYLMSKFLEKESNQLIKQFQSHLKYPEIKKWLLKSGQGSPWLLRKLCSDIYNQFFSEEDVATFSGDQIDIKKIFDNDLERYINTPQQDTCLKYIAKNAPLPMSEVIETFGSDVVENLEINRLIIRTGANYTIYSDIFKEYINDGKLPIITFNYRAKNNVCSALDALDLILASEHQEMDSLTLLNLIKRQKQISELTLKNIREDLKGFGLIMYQDKILKANKNFNLKTDYDIANYLEEKLYNHAVLNEVYKLAKPGGLGISYKQFEQLIIEIYSLKTETEKHKKAVRDTASRLRSWFFFAGLLEKNIH